MDKKSIVALIAGVIVGGIAGFFVGKKQAGPPIDEQAYLDEINQLIDECAQARKERAEKEHEPVAKALTPKEMQYVATSYGNKGDMEKMKQEAARYHDPDFTQHIAERSYPRDDWDDSETIEEITEEHAKGIEGFEMEQCYYYPMDDILIDMNGDIPQYPVTILGEKLLATIRERTDDIIYVINNATYSIYEIIMEHGVSFESNGEEEPVIVDEEDEDEDDGPEVIRNVFDPRHPGRG